eukprot:1191611-Prorocentrum_minimum.AAC.1
MNLEEEVKESSSDTNEATATLTKRQRQRQRPGISTASLQCLFPILPGISPVSLPYTPGYLSGLTGYNSGSLSRVSKADERCYLLVYDCAVCRAYRLRKAKACVMPFSRWVTRRHMAYCRSATPTHRHTSGSDGVALNAALPPPNPKPQPSQKERFGSFCSCLGSVPAG